VIPVIHLHGVPEEKRGSRFECGTSQIQIRSTSLSTAISNYLNLWSSGVLRGVVW
jgi:hypothetical protein